MWRFCRNSMWKVRNCVMPNTSPAGRAMAFSLLRKFYGFSRLTEVRPGRARLPHQTATNTHAQPCMFTRAHTGTHPRKNADTQSRVGPWNRTTACSEAHAEACDARGTHLGPAHCTGEQRCENTGSVRKVKPSICTSRVAWPTHVTCTASSAPGRYQCQTTKRTTVGDASRCKPGGQTCQKAVSLLLYLYCCFRCTM